MLFRKMKRGNLFLIPGASAMGFRLPLDSIRKATKEDLLDELSPIEAEFPPLSPDPLSPYDAPAPEAGGDADLG